MIRSCLLAALLLGATADVVTAQSLQASTFVVVDGRTMQIDGGRIQLADIAVPELGETCIWHSQTLDCGVLARAGLMDITAGATLECRPAGDGGHRCFAGDYDLGFGMIHAGWAIALPDAPAHYHRRMKQAREKKRALWSATDVDGTPEYALKLKR